MTPNNTVIHTTDANFDKDVLQSTLPVLLDYWAPWCGPCKQIAPILDALAVVYAGKLVIAKINVDENPNTSGKFGIRGIPTLMLFKNGAVSSTKVGALTQSQLATFIDEQLS